MHDIKRNSRRTGFTLLEMSIVVVIIGLLVGALMGMRAYLKNAQLTSMMNETKYYINAFGQFQQQYNAVPGDFANASNTWSGADNGDGNGVLRTNSTCSSGGTSCSTSELFYVFEHLADAGLITGHYSALGGGAAPAVNRGVNVPSGAVNGVVYMFDHPNDMGGNVGATDPVLFPSTTSGLYGHILIAAPITAAATNTSIGYTGNAFLTPNDAMRLDAKYDDGIPTTGAIVMPNATNMANCTSTTVCPTGVATCYNTASAAPACYLILRIQ